MEKILIIDDELAISSLIKLILKKENYIVETADAGNKGIDLIHSFKPDLIILDLMLPDMSGYDVLRKVNTENHIPVIMVSARNEVIDKVLGLELGAEDYISKPFDNRELITRVKVALRRMQQSPVISSRFSYLDIEIDFNNKIVLKNGQEIQLTPKEYNIIELLAKNPKKLFSREDLLSKIWEFDYVGTSRTIDITINRLRKKIEDNPNEPNYIKTVWGFGYCFGRE